MKSIAEWRHIYMDAIASPEPLLIEELIEMVQKDAALFSGSGQGSQHNPRYGMGSSANNGTTQNGMQNTCNQNPYNPIG